MPEVSGAEFIAKTNPDIQKYIENSVVQYQKQEEKENPNLKPDKKAGDRVEAHLLRMETVLKDTDSERVKRKLKIFKAMIYPKVLIDKDNIPDSYFALQLKIARERGQDGDLLIRGIKEVSDIPQEERQKEGKMLYNDQRKSLDVWFDYMLDKDSPYPTWFKYYVLKSVSGLGSYDKEKKQFGKRTKNTINIFPDLNREALSFVYDVVVQRHLKGINEGEPDFQRIVNSANFGKIYAYAIDKVTPASKENKEKIEGQWVKYDQGSDPTPLCESLQGHGTGWCTAGEETAKAQLEKGDFYVYYTKDQDNKNTIPRIAIRMESGEVAEIRGIGPNQEMEENMLDIAREKSSQLPGGDIFEQKVVDMKLLNEIDKKVKDNQELTKRELRFLYEMDRKIESFGYVDLRTNEITTKIGNLECLSKFSDKKDRQKILYHFLNEIYDYSYNKASHKNISLSDDLVGEIVDVLDMDILDDHNTTIEVTEKLILDKTFKISDESYYKLFRQLGKTSKGFLDDYDFSHMRNNLDIKRLDKISEIIFDNGDKETMRDYFCLLVDDRISTKNLNQAAKLFFTEFSGEYQLKTVLDSLEEGNANIFRVEKIMSYFDTTDKRTIWDYTMKQFFRGKFSGKSFDTAINFIFSKVKEKNKLLNTINKYLQSGRFKGEELAKLRELVESKTNNS